MASRRLSLGRLDAAGTACFGQLRTDTVRKSGAKTTAIEKLIFGTTRKQQAKPLSRVGRRNKPHLMADLRELTAPVMRASARLKRYDAAWLFREKVEQLGSADLLAENHAAALIKTMRVKNMLCDIKANGSKL